MKTYRDIPKAFNDPMTILGFPVAALAFTVIGFAVLMLTPLSKIVIALTCIAILAAAKALAAYDIRFLRVVWRALRQKALYTPERRDVFRLEIK